MATLGWGVIGLGNIVQGTMAPGIVESPDCDLVAGVSRDQGRADAFAAKFGARYAYTDYAEMLANPEVEAVFIATPNALHADEVIAAAEAGKHVMCDKPLATSVDDAVRAAAACEKAGVKLGINFHNRRLAWVNDTKAMVAEGKIGKVLNIQVEASTGRKLPSDWRADKSLAGLGTIYSQGVHVYDFLAFILDSDPVEVMAMFDDEGFEVESQAMALIRYANGTQVFANINQRIPYPQNDIALYGMDGRITGVGLTRSRLDGDLKVLTKDGETVTAYPQPSGVAHRENLVAFTKAILAGEQPSASGIDGLKSMLLTDAIARSAAEHTAVQVDYSRLPAAARAAS